MRTYPVTYKDRFGEESTTILSDGSTMCLTLRAIEFKGIDFEMLSGKMDHTQFEYEKYQDGTGYLTNFEMDVQFPIKINSGTIADSGEITAHIRTGREKETLVSLELTTAFGKFLNSKKHEWFEDALIEIQQLLPQKCRIKSCLSCRYSNYHPIGNGMFGGLHCFRNLKCEARHVSNKGELMLLWQKGEEENKIFNVQEIYDCPEHAFLTQKDWAYKSWS
ncbi:DUF6304 family protein [Pseudozobellia thermophila]|uniref:Uncharacterized protein n=1 Tax=Pseudozobellia thermophila TaxID=192903 RepID=A0A1M6NRX8_9FLAO|nr:DUF6304 family protein [Pseudozobellia thermophila]SHJ98332.1 hypothetical protein SAMN04488513_11515 [Pseudozobellia thermophila]